MRALLDALLVVLGAVTVSWFVQSTRMLTPADFQRRVGRG